MSELTWHVVVSQGGRALGVFGSALLADAQECARRVERETGCHAWVRQVKGQRPSVGEQFTNAM